MKNQLSFYQLLAPLFLILLPFYIATAQTNNWPTTTTTACSGTTNNLIWDCGNVGVGTTSPQALLDVDGDAIFNESGADKDLRVEGDNEQFLLVVDGGQDNVGIGISAPNARLDVVSSTSATAGKVNLNSSSTATNIVNSQVFAHNTFFSTVSGNENVYANMKVEASLTGSDVIGEDASVAFGFNNTLEHDGLITIGVYSEAIYTGTNDDATIAGGLFEAFVETQPNTITAFAVGALGSALDAHDGFNIGLFGETQASDYQIGICGFGDIADEDDPLSDLMTTFSTSFVAGGYFTNDNTGSSDFGIYVDGTAQSYIAVNLGIGTNSPGFMLDVADNLDGYAARIFNDGNNANRNVLKLQGGADDASGTTVYVQALDGDGGEVGRIENASGTFQLVDVSDARSKTNIEPTEVEARNVINELSVVDFNRISSPDGQRHTGFIAQEVQKVYPYAVSQVEGSEYLGVAKGQLVPVLVKAMQEQDEVIANLEASNEQLEGKLEAFEKMMVEMRDQLNQLQSCCNGSGKGAAGIDHSGVSTFGDRSYIDQNMPNPFSGNTEISFYVGSDVNQASIVVYDINGHQIRSMDIAESGNGKVTFNAGELSPGVYFYSLYTDKKEVDTKRMIITD